MFSVLFLVLKVGWTHLIHFKTQTVGKTLNQRATKAIGIIMLKYILKAHLILAKEKNQYLLHISRESTTKKTTRTVFHILALLNLFKGGGGEHWERKGENFTCQF